MRVAHGVIGHLQIPESLILTAAPDGAIAALVAGEILDHRLHLRAVRISGIGQGNMRVAALNTETTIGLRAAVDHQSVEIGVGDVALELPQLGSTWPGCLADIRA